LKDFARTCGNVLYSEVYMEGGKKKGVIEFGSEREVKEAIDKLDNTKLDGALVHITKDTSTPSSSNGNGRASRSRTPPRRR
jgi:RNA recognition motif-containing protein